MKRTRALVAVAALSALALGGAAPVAISAPDDGPSVTVYSSADPAGFDPQRYVAEQRMGWNPQSAWGVPGYGVVKDVRKVDLREGASDLRFTDVAEFIDPTTVSFTDLTDPAGTSVLEQNFEFDLVSPSKLLEKYVDREIAHETTKDGQVVARITGKVLSVNQGQVVLQTAEGLRFLAAGDPGIRLPSLPEGLITKPTLVWKVVAAKAGAHDVRTTYQAAGLTWRADYNVVLNGDDTKADLGAWVTLLNLGQSFDVVGERTQTDFKIDTSRRTIEETIRVQLRNHKAAPARVVVKENLYRWTNWEITAKSDDFTKPDARTIHFDVAVPADGEKTVTYTVRYTW